MDRTSSGQFAVGVSGNPGGQSKEKKTLLAALKEIDHHFIADSLEAHIRQGNLKAIDLYLQYVLGKPKAGESNKENVYVHIGLPRNGTERLNQLGGPCELCGGPYTNPFQVVIDPAEQGI